VIGGSRQHKAAADSTRRQQTAQGSSRQHKTAEVTAAEDGTLWKGTASALFL